MTTEQYFRNLRVPEGRIDAVLDTDAFNEIDDQFALAYLLRSEEKVCLREVFAAPFWNGKSVSPEDGMEKSYGEILKVLSLCGRDDLAPRTEKGSRTYLPDEKTPVFSPAAQRLSELAMEYSPEKPLYVVAIGAITNIASALLLQPELKERTVVVWLGGNRDDADEFNMKQDIAAARVVFGCGVPLVQLPCAGVVKELATTEPELRFWLCGKNPLSDYLACNTIREAEQYAKGKPWSRTIWDVAAAAWLLNDDNRFFTSVLRPAVIPEYDLLYANHPDRHFIRVISAVNRDAIFQDLFRKLTETGSPAGHD